MLWLICILCQKLMEFFMVHSEILEDIRLDLMFIQPPAEFFRLIDGKAWCDSKRLFKLFLRIIWIKCEQDIVVTIKIIC